MFNTSFFRKQWWPLLALLAACGGGGGGGDDAPANSLPKANFVVTPDAPQVDTELVFNANSSSDTDGQIQQYRWQFGDGNSGEGSLQTHSYSAQGEYTVKLTVVDNRGASAVHSKVLQVVAGYSLSGEIQVAGSIITDSDVNDPAAPYIRNDLVELAQLLPNPTTVNGFASSEGTGDADDRFAAQGDIADVYRISLLAGQHISLQNVDYKPAEPLAQDLDIYLLNSDRQLVGASDGSDELESLIAPGSGTHYLVIHADSGSNKYVLHVGNDFTSGRIAGRATSVDFLSNEVIVRYNSSAQASTASTRARNIAPSGVQLQKFDSIEETRDRLKALDPGQHTAGLDATSRRVPTNADEELLKTSASYTTLRLIKALKKQSDVAYAEPNYRIDAARVPNDQYYDLQWHYPFINLPAAWDINVGVSQTEQVVVAVIDSGVLIDHPDLAGQLIDGYDFISDPEAAADGDGIDPNPNDAGDRENPSERSSFHGTHVTGTVAALSDGYNGIAGVAWGAKVMPVRVLGVDGGSGYDLNQALRYAAGLNNDSGRLPIKPADVINLSLGCSACYNQSIQDTLAEIRAAGVIVIAAAGNFENSIPFYPSAYEGVVSVSAVHSGYGRASYSNFGGFVDISAPGGDSTDRDGDGYADQILSTLGDDSGDELAYLYSWYNGTSMAAPHVAGIAALMKAVYHDLDPIQFDQLIQTGEIVTDLGEPGRDDNFGYGIIDAAKAVHAAQELSGGPVQGSVTTTPTVLDFANTVESKSLLLESLGDEAPSVISVDTQQDWLEVRAGINIDERGMGQYIVEVDRSGLETAVHQGSVRFQLSSGTLIEVPVFLQVLDLQNGIGDAGLLYVLLRNADDTDDTLQVEVHRGAGGSYQYRFDEAIKSGTYSLFAGSDIDNDKIICGPGETCGAWPTRHDAQDFDIHGQLHGIDFKLVTDSEFSISQQRP